MLAWKVVWEGGDAGQPALGWKHASDRYTAVIAPVVRASFVCSDRVTLHYFTALRCSVPLFFVSQVDDVHALWSLFEALTCMYTVHVHEKL